MNYHEAAVQVLEKIGGKENLISGAHCATRLRLVVKDEKNIKKKRSKRSRVSKAYSLPRDSSRLFSEPVL
ncbi:MAG: PTS transporter subunit EIIB [Ruminococcus sp.]